MMERKRKLIFAKIAVVMGAIPFLIWAYEYGPDPGYVAIPGENGGATCATSGCHSGKTNDPTHSGSVSVSFPSGLTYTPGVKQHLSVTISDPASTQAAWGFQLSARPSNNAKTMAGVFVPTDPDTQLMCSQANLAVFQPMCLPGAGPSCSPTSAPACNSSQPLQYMEHSLNGYEKTMGNGSGSYQFDWTPPASSVGNITVYVAGNAGVPGPPTKDGDHIYATTYTLTFVPPCPTTGNTPNVCGVVNGASFQPGIVPGSWLTIQGTNLASTTDTWDKAIVNGKLPTTLDGVSVSVGSKPAFVYYISPSQINVQAPDVGSGPVPVTVTTANGTSTAVTATVAQQAPAFFLWPNSQAVATRQDGSYAVKSGTFAGAATEAAKPGDVLILWGTGFGPTTPPVAAGIQVPSDTLHNCSPVTVSLGSTTPAYFGCALSPGFAGLYQVVIQVPGSMADGNYPMKATVNGASSPDGVILSVKK